MSDQQTHERLTAARCLRNAHADIAGAYANLDGSSPFTTATHKATIRQTLDAVDWIRRALEHLGGLRD